MIGYASYSYVAGRIENCFWDIEASGRPSWSGGKGLATAQMQDIRTFLAAGWDFSGERANGTVDLWEMPEGGGYPRLTCVTHTSRRRLPGQARRLILFRLPRRSNSAS